jgi:N-acetylgalactosamine kinase
MDAFNRRSIECKLAAALLGSHLEKAYQVRGIAFIGDLTATNTALSEQLLEEVVHSTVHEHPYSLHEIAAVLGINHVEVVTRWCHRRDGSTFPEPMEGFKLYQRLMHVWSEWKRVEAMVDALRAGDVLQAGTLMDESHASCRDLHEISCPELDALTTCCREAGALGSRLTGAGFGGCTISIVPTAILQSFMEQVGQVFYQDRMGITDWSQWMFPVAPSDGARWRCDNL